METADQALHMEPIAPTLPRVRNPRPVWMEALLFFSTLGVYHCFWMVGRARDIRRYASNDYRPWLWFFVPLTGVIQLFAYPRFFKGLTLAEGEDSPAAWKNFDWAWILLVFLASITITFQERLAWPEWIFILAFILSIVLFSILHKRFNRWKRKLSDVEFHGKRSGYQWYEWLALVTCAPIALIVFYLILIEPLFVKEIEKLAPDQRIVNEEFKFSFDIKGQGWRSVEQGTVSDSESILELKGPLVNSYLIVYDYGDTMTLESLSESRTDEAEELFGRANCEEYRTLSDNGDSVIVTLQCQGKSVGDPASTLSRLIMSDGRLIELYGYVSGAKIPYASGMRAMKEIVEGFKPL